MRSLAVDGYTATAVEAALTRSGRTVRFAYDLVAADGTVLGEVDNVTGGTVRNNALAEIKRTATLEVASTAEINVASDRIRPRFLLTMPDGGIASWPLGLFLLSSPTGRYGPGATTTIEAYDQGLILLEDKLLDRLVVAAGASYTATVDTLLAGAGIASRYVTSSPATLPADRDWPPGTPLLEIVNELLTAINWRTLTFDADGRAVSTPYLSPAEQGTGWTYAAGTRSILAPTLERTFDLFDLANAWVVTVSEADRPPLRSSYVNDDPASPTSTVARGRTIVDHRTVDAADQAALDAYVARIAFAASQVYEAVEVETATMPHHADADTIRLVHPTAGISARYTEHTWELPLEVGAQMTHRLRRIVTV